MLSLRRMSLHSVSFAARLHTSHSPGSRYRTRMTLPNALQIIVQTDVMHFIAADTIDQNLILKICKDELTQHVATSGWTSRDRRV